MTQALYAHMNNKTIKEKSEALSSNPNITKNIFGLQHYNMKIKNHLKLSSNVSSALS
jgi:hypothetical protein